MLRRTLTLMLATAGAIALVACSNQADDEPAATAGAAAAATAAPTLSPDEAALAALPRIDGKPDFTGVWTTYRGGGGPAFNTDGGGGQPELTAIAQQKVDAYRAVTEGTNHSPGAYCVGSGMPGSMTGSGGYPMGIIQHPKVIHVTYEAHKETRRIYIGDHGYKLDEIFHERNGFSQGHWEDDTLVVEVSHLEEQIDSRTPHSDQATITERYTLGIEDGRRVITNEWTMTDPVFYTGPMSGTKRWAELEGGRLLNYECTEPQWAEIVERLLAGETIGYEGE